ncbi:MAG: hypothetical protein MZV70_39990 [Desulfobacterales bacterium]|nr:hypothetical protein [Desulfobacterales bacterium]
MGGISPMSEGIAQPVTPVLQVGRPRPDRADHHQRRRRHLRHRWPSENAKKLKAAHGRQAVHLPHPGGRGQGRQEADGRAGQDRRLRVRGQRRSTSRRRTPWPTT